MSLTKAREIYDWIAANIEYDLAARRVTSPVQVLRGRRAACEGFVALYSHLARQEGLEAVRIPGFARGVSYRAGDPDVTANHVWNAVRVEGHWHLLDVTFARHGDFFAVPPRQFVYTHLPTDPQWQLLPTPVPSGEHAALPVMLPGAFRHSVLPETRASRVTCQPLTSLFFRTPEGVGLDAAVPGGSCLVCPLAGVQRVDISLPGPGEYFLQVAAGPRAAERLEDALYYRLVAQDGIAPGPLPETFLGYRARGATLLSPRSLRLREGDCYHFDVRIPGAQSASLHCGSWESRLFPGLGPLVVPGLDRGYQANLRLPAGEVLLVADGRDVLCRFDVR